MNQIFVRPRPAKQIRLVTNMFRWMDAAFVGYAGARESLSAYTSVERGRPSMPEYFLTISLEAGKNTMSEVTAAHARDYESFTTHLST